MPWGQSGGRSGTPRRGCADVAVFFPPIVSWKLCDIPLEFCSRAIHLTRRASFRSFDISPTPNYYFQCTVRPLITGIGFPVRALTPLSVTKTFCVFDSCDCFCFSNSLLTFISFSSSNLQFEKKNLTFFSSFL